MYETWHLATAYTVGTIAGIGIFRWWVKERIIAMTIDSLVEQEFVRSYHDEEGTMYLYKWHDMEDLLDKIRIVTEEEARTEEEDEKNNTP